MHSFRVRNTRRDLLHEGMFGLEVRRGGGLLLGDGFGLTHENIIKKKRYINTLRENSYLSHMINKLLN